MTRIVILDGYTLNPGDLSWQGFEALGACTPYDRTPENQVVERAKDAEILLTNKAIVARKSIEKLDRVRYIGVLATGYNTVDTVAARERGIPVANVPRYGSDSVAQMVFAHLLRHTQHVAAHGRTVYEGRWSASPDWCTWDYPLIELRDLTLGIVGLGEIGRTVAALAMAFGMRVLAYTVPHAACEGVSLVDLDTLLQESDVVSLHCPLTPETEGLINAERLAKMKQTAFLINTSRGPLIDEPALAEALERGQIAGAGLDVLSVEPPDASNPLLKAKHCTITPHIAWATRSARERLMRIAVENVAAFLEGKPVNVVNPVVA